MPTICRFRGIKISINWRDHMPPHFHASYGEDEVIVSIMDIEGFGRKHALQAT